jgi:hypothetical protein
MPLERPCLADVWTGCLGLTLIHQLHQHAFPSAGNTIGGFSGQSWPDALAWAFVPVALHD